MGTNKNVRYLEKITNGRLTDGSKIRIVGRVPSPAAEFTIDLMKEAEGEIIILHFNPRLYENAVVLNTHSSGGWQQEERQDACPTLPFVPGLPFTIEIYCRPDHFNILVNKEQFADYAYRLPVEEVMYIRALDDVGIVRVERTT